MRIILPKDLETISLAVCGHFNLKLSVLRKKTRIASIVQARQLTWYLLYTICGASLSNIGKEFGKGPSTIQRGLQNVRNLAVTDAKCAATLYTLDDRCRILLKGAK